LNIDLNKDVDYEPILKAGIEYLVSGKLYLRTGMNTNPFKGFFGVGILPGRFKIDYAIGTHQFLGNSHQASVSFNYLKNMKSRIWLIIIICLLFYQLKAQNEKMENLEFDRIIENLLPLQELDLDYNDFYDRLFTLYTNPLDLNRADRHDFQSLYVLTEQQISGIISYRDNYGNFFSI